ncbi:hypothetical protein [Nitrococcus mobilis]|uniref:hypothetical protein n=1 Tax=Nitrococcus mobilis TaxID=35797 RepID=UPI0005910ECA|nr:hypothetical protein [Nitrococcus mobilis]
MIEQSGYGRRMGLSCRAVGQPRPRTPGRCIDQLRGIVSGEYDIGNSYYFTCTMRPDVQSWRPGGHSQDRREPGELGAPSAY